MKIRCSLLRGTCDIPIRYLVISPNIDPMKSTSLILGVVTLVLLAGCGGVLQNTDTPAEVDDTATKTPSPTSAPDERTTNTEAESTETDTEKPDTDGDGIPDSEEESRGTNPEKVDSDGDRLNDREEMRTLDTNPTISDTDRDGLNDSEEIREYDTDPTVEDSDEDGLNDTEEIHVYETDPTLSDGDRDGVNDSEEVREHGTAPKLADTDEDGIDDAKEIREYGTDPTAADTDEDGLNDSEEISSETDPTDVHTDYDELNDGREAEIGTDPTDHDTDSDGLPDDVEVEMTGLFPGADPLHKDVYLEIDYVSRISSSEMDEIRSRYAEAPVSNPDGKQGVTLHLYWDDTLSCSGSTDLTGITTDPGCEGGGADIRGYYNGRIVEEVEIEGEDYGGFASSGGFYSEWTGSSDSSASLVMHELGHVLGIRGGDGVDSYEKSYDEYPSVMNYNAPRDSLRYTESDWAIIESQLENAMLASGWQIREQPDDRDAVSD